MAQTPDPELIHKRYFIGLATQLDPAAKHIIGVALRKLYAELDVDNDGKLDKSICEVFAVDDPKDYEMKLRALNQAFGTGKGYDKF